MTEIILSKMIGPIGMTWSPQTDRSWLQPPLLPPLVRLDFLGEDAPIAAGGVFSSLATGAPMFTTEKFL
jgi:hypothetical protein